MSDATASEIAASTRLWSIPQAAERLGMSERYVWNLVADGTLRTVKQGRRTLVRDDDLAAYIDARTENGV
jgi:excisionase family DNA binding protein